MWRRTFIAGSVLVTVAACAAGAQEAPTRAEAQQALRKAAEYYRAKVARHGGYVYYTSEDLQQRWGEGVASPDQIFVQPPGTPSVGMAYLQAFKATGNRYYLDAALETGKALIHGQLTSGGWTQSVVFNPKGSKVARYRNGKGGGKANSTLDDGISQAAIRFLARLDQALEFKDREVHDAAQVALDALLKAQFPNGAFPQVWTGPVKPQPVVKASFPSYDWRTEGRVDDYWTQYTLNDGLAGTVTDTLQEAFEVYKDDRYRKAMLRLGDFLLLAQLPDPQPAWAQQYSYAMHPIWARKFEPAAVTGGESQDAIATLMKITRLTGDKKYLAPIPGALAYLKRSLLPDGRLARYYELKTNRPLYMERSGNVYSLTFSDANLPDHYGWKQPSRLPALEKEYEALKAGKSVSPAAAGQPTAKQVIRDLDAQGRWVSTYAGEGLVGQPKFQRGFRYLDSAVFNRNVGVLADFLGGKPVR